MGTCQRGKSFIATIEKKIKQALNNVMFNKKFKFYRFSLKIPTK